MSLFKLPHYRSFLLRLWEETSQQAKLPGIWRFSLEDPHTGERRGFVNLEALVVFLRKQIGGSEDDPQADQADQPKLNAEKGA